MADFFRADLTHCIGTLKLRARFALHAPWTVLFGPSGAGKTTLLRLIAGLDSVQTGSIELDGRTLVDTSAGVCRREQAIGLLMQQPSLFPHMSVGQNVAFGLHALSAAERHSRTMTALELCGAAGLTKRRPASLSGGEQQRVGLARALAREPRLLLLDEPFSALDAAARTELIGHLLPWLCGRRIGVLYVSHSLAEAWQGHAEALLMEDGKVSGGGPAKDVLAPHRAALLRQLGAGEAGTLFS